MVPKLPSRSIHVPAPEGPRSRALGTATSQPATPQPRENAAGWKGFLRLTGSRCRRTPLVLAAAAP